MSVPPPGASSSTQKDDLDSPSFDAPPSLWKREGVRSSAIATTSTVVFFGAIVALVVTSPNWTKVKEQFFSRQDFVDSWPRVLKGFWINLELFAYSTVSVAILALVIAVMRSLRGPAFTPLRIMATVYTDLFRGIPLVLLIFLIGFGLPALQINGLTNSAKFWGVVALTLSYSAYTAEIYRSGIDAVPESQRSSARALGLTQWQSMRFAILPQAVRNVIPALMNTVVSLQKDVALLSILGIREAVREADIYKGRTFNYTAYIAATVLFLLISVPLTRYVDWFTARDRRRRSQAPV